MSGRVDVGDLLLRLLDCQIRSVLQSTEAVARHIFLQVHALQEIAALLEQGDGDGEELRRRIRAVAASVAEEMQFQDTTRQQLEHVQASIGYFVETIGRGRSLLLEEERAEALFHRIREGYVMERERLRHDAVLRGEDPDLVAADEGTDDEQSVDLF